MSLDTTIAQAVERAVAKALDRPTVPRLAYTIEEAATALACGTGTVRRLIAEGHLRTIPDMGRSVLIPRRDLEAFASGDASTSPGTPPPRAHDTGGVDGPSEATVTEMPSRAGEPPATDLPHDAA